MSAPTFTLGDRLRKAREHAGLEQAQLAQLLGLSRQSVSNYERDLRTPNAAVILAWSIHTAAPCQWLETGQEVAA